ncbi:hypothetical protein NQZ68_016567 [Dissostichus eleginoides]|nr:hypothetical protein NQZ68_016567 [Dissostichus eleginoides]
MNALLLPGVLMLSSRGGKWILNLEQDLQSKHSSSQEKSALTMMSVLSAQTSQTLRETRQLISGVSNITHTALRTEGDTQPVLALREKCLRQHQQV